MSTIREYDDVVDEVIVTSQDATYLVSGGSGNADIKITLNENVQGILFSGVELTFADNDPSDDTITRNKGSWIDDNFEAGMTITITGTASNNNSFLIADVTDLVLTMDNAVALTDEADVVPTSAVGNIADADWFLHEQVTAGNHKYTVFENGPTGIRITRTSGSGVKAWVRS